MLLILFVCQWLKDVQRTKWHRASFEWIAVIAENCRLAVSSNQLHRDEGNNKAGLRIKANDRRRPAPQRQRCGPRRSFTLSCKQRLYWAQIWGGLTPMRTGGAGRRIEFMGGGGKWPHWNGHNTLKQVWSAVQAGRRHWHVGSLRKDNCLCVSIYVSVCVHVFLNV